MAQEKERSCMDLFQMPWCLQSDEGYETDESVEWTQNPPPQVEKISPAESREFIDPEETLVNNSVVPGQARPDLFLVEQHPPSPTSRYIVPGNHPSPSTSINIPLDIVGPIIPEGKASPKLTTTDGTAASLKTDVMRIGQLMAEEKTPLQESRAGGKAEGVTKRGEHLGSESPSGTSRKWTDNTLEGFLHLTLVEGTGLVLTKLDPNETQKKLGERILSYDAKAMRLEWVSTGLRRKPGGIFAKDIVDVFCDGTVVTIVYLALVSRSLRRGSLPSMRQATTTAEKRKAFRAAKERDAQILQEILLLVQRKAKKTPSVVADNAIADKAVGRHASRGKAKTRRSRSVA